MSLVSQITSIITGLYPDATFILSSVFHANKQSFDIETADMPLIVLDNELSKDAEIMLNNNVQKDTRVVISILNKDSFENSDLESDTIRQEMEDMGDRIAVNIYQLEEIRPIGNQKYKITPAFHVYNTELTGAIIEMRANENTIVNFTKP